MGLLTRFVVLPGIPVGEFPFVLLAVWSSGACAWAYGVWWLAKLARDKKDERFWGALCEAALMVAVFAVPLILAVYVPGWLKMDEYDSAVVLMVVGLFMSGVVSVPVRRCVVEGFRLTPGVSGKDE